MSIEATKKKITVGVLELYLLLNDIIMQHGENALSDEDTDIYLALSKHPAVQSALGSNNRAR